MDQLPAPCAVQGSTQIWWVQPAVRSAVIALEARTRTLTVLLLLAIAYAPTELSMELLRPPVWQAVKFFWMTTSVGQINHIYWITFEIIVVLELQEARAQAVR